MNVDPTVAHWFKSSYSESGSQCVEVAFLDEATVGVRDSKNPTGPALTFTRQQWSTFTAGVAGNQFGIL